MEYDVIVVGAGPAGSAAAKAAAQSGARTIILEEHKAVGIPQHCPGRIQGSSFTESIMSSINRRMIVTDYRARRIFAPNGKIAQEIPLAGKGFCLVERAEFDRELAIQAIKAGADLKLNSPVSSVLRIDGKVAGVITESPSSPQVSGKVIISAQGIRAWSSGLLKQEFKDVTEIRPSAGILFELTGVKDLEPEIVETHIGAFNDDCYCTVWPKDGHSCIMSISSLDAFNRLKSGNYLISRKLKGAVPIQINGWSLTSVNKSSIKGVNDGMILVGNARGHSGIIHAIVSGQLAGEIAATAVKNGDVSENNLNKYEFLCKKVGLHLTGRDGAALSKLRMLSDEAIAAILPEMALRNELEYLDQLPF